MASKNNSYNELANRMQSLQAFLETSFTEKSKIVEEIKKGDGNASDLTDFNEQFYPEFHHKLEEFVSFIEKDPKLKNNPAIQNIYADLLSKTGASNKLIEETLEKFEFGTDHNRPNPH
jgi:hypothetical protein